MKRLSKPGRLVLALTAVAVAAFATVAVLGSCTAINPYYEASRPHHRPDGFANNYGPGGGKRLSEVLSWYLDRFAEGLPRPPSRYIAGYEGFEVLTPDLAMLHASARNRVTATWIGHATMLLQIGGLNVLTDPQFSERAFMVQWMGPKRRARVPVPLEKLPRIDLVVISHSHYDHLDLDTVRALNRQPGGPPLFAVPLGVDRWMKDNGIDHVKRFDWWDRHRLGDVDITFVPVQHWSQRTPFDRNRTLWGGWVLRAPTYSVFFSGDTGYSKDFADIGERIGGVDLALIPVGVYEPRDFMKPQHVNPEEAVRIHQDVRARLSIGVHWGTFELGDEPLDQPIGDLARALQTADVSADRFILLKHGETRILTP